MLCACGYQYIPYGAKEIKFPSTWDYLTGSLMASWLQPSNRPCDRRSFNSVMDVIENGKRPKNVNVSENGQTKLLK